METNFQLPFLLIFSHQYLFLFFSDIDECAAGEHSCQVGTYCHNTEGIFIILLVDFEKAFPWLWDIYSWLWTCFTLFSIVFIVDIEQVNVCRILTALTLIWEDSNNSIAQTMHKYN